MSGTVGGEVSRFPFCGIDSSCSGKTLPFLLPTVEKRARQLDRCGPTVRDKVLAQTAQQYPRRDLHLAVTRCVTSSSLATPSKHIALTFSSGPIRDTLTPHRARGSCRHS